MYGNGTFMVPHQISNSPAATEDNTSERQTFTLERVYSYVIEVVDSEFAFGFYNKGLVTEIRVLDSLLIRVPFTLEFYLVALLFKRVNECMMSLLI